MVKKQCKECYTKFGDIKTEECPVCKGSLLEISEDTSKQTLIGE